jgi:hypothetical protein
MMSEETANLILEHLRGLRAEIADLRQDMRGVQGRIDTMEAEMRGTGYGIFTALGSIVHDLKEMNERIAKLETAA